MPWELRWTGKTLEDIEKAISGATGSAPRTLRELFAPASKKILDLAPKIGKRVPIVAFGITAGYTITKMTEPEKREDFILTPITKTLFISHRQFTFNPSDEIRFQLRVPKNFVGINARGKLIRVVRGWKDEIVDERYIDDEVTEFVFTEASKYPGKKISFFVEVDVGDKKYKSNTVDVYISTIEEQKKEKQIKLAEFIVLIAAIMTALYVFRGYRYSIPRRY